MGAAAASTYKTKKTTGVFNAHKHKYTEKQIALIQEKNSDHLYYFGYTNSPADDDNSKYAFFDFKEHKEEHKKAYYGFREQNKKHLATLVKDGGWKGPKYAVNQDKECFDFYPMDQVHKV